MKKAPDIESVRESIMKNGFWWHQALKVPAVEVASTWAQGKATGKEGG